MTCQFTFQLALVDLCPFRSPVFLCLLIIDHLQIDIVHSICLFLIGHSISLTSLQLESDAATILQELQQSLNCVLDDLSAVFAARWVAIISFQLLHPHPHGLHLHFAFTLFPFFSFIYFYVRPWGLSFFISSDPICPRRLTIFHFYFHRPNCNLHFGEQKK